MATCQAVVVELHEVRCPRRGREEATSDPPGRCFVALLHLVCVLFAAIHVLAWHEDQHIVILVVVAVFAVVRPFLPAGLAWRSGEGLSLSMARC